VAARGQISQPKTDSTSHHKANEVIIGGTEEQ